MTQLTTQLAATHDQWFEEPAAKHTFPALKLSWRHFSKYYPTAADGLEWAGCGAVAVTILFGTLLANAQLPANSSRVSRQMVAFVVSPPPAD
jgi:hypothetical protein